MALTCPACGKGSIVCETWLKEFEHKGETLEAEYMEEYCDACGTLTQSPNTIHHNLLTKMAAIKAYEDRTSRTR